MIGGIYLPPKPTPGLAAAFEAEGPGVLFGIIGEGTLGKLQADF